MSGLRLEHCPQCGNILNTYPEALMPELMKCVNCQLAFALEFERVGIWVSAVIKAWPFLPTHKLSTEK